MTPYPSPSPLQHLATVFLAFTGGALCALSIVEYIVSGQPS